MADVKQLYSTTRLGLGETSRRLFFFEETLPASARNVRHVFPAVEKLGVVLRQDGPGLAGNCSSFGGSIVRLDDGGLRLYYTAYPAGFGTMHMAVAESEDGLSWRKVSLGQVKIDGQDTNFLEPPGRVPERDFNGQPVVLRLPDGRWRMYHWRHANKGYQYIISNSDDGLNWTINSPVEYAFVDHWIAGRGQLTDGLDPDTDERHKNLSAAEKQRVMWHKSRRTNDASFVYYNDQLGRFEYYAQWFVPAAPDKRVEVDNCPAANRYIQRRFSADGVQWSAPELIIRPDERDAWDQQFYHLAVQCHENWIIGSLGHYRVEGGQQTQELELCFSRDGKKWHRPLRGGFVPRGRDGEPDCEGIYPPQAWVEQGDHWLALYTGTSVPHNKALGKEAPHPTGIMAARWPKHRFVGLGAGRVTGGFMTEPFYPQQPMVTVDATVRGWLRAELCDVHGRKHAGYHLMDSTPVKGDHTAHEIRWGEKTIKPYQFDAVRLRFEFNDADVFGVGF